MADAYRDLIAWRKATQLAVEIYRVTQKFPKDELYGLTSQMRRAAVSVASNIAEGKGRYSRKEFAQFLYRARGSLLELETQLFIARELQYLEPLAFRRMEDKTNELGRILNGLTKSVLDSRNVAS
jgi:four helix bundle protein